MTQYSHLDSEIEQGIAFLSQNDPVMRGLIEKVGVVQITPATDMFRCIVENIICQVISAKAADTIIARLEAFTEGRIEPAVLSEISQEDFRSLGIGKQKFGYIQHLAARFLEEPDRFNHLPELSDDEVIKALVSLKGIGKWTAQMFLIFGLGRLDVFAPDDLVLRQSFEQFYDWPSVPTNKEMVERAEMWSPYRSIASLYLWKSKRLADRQA